MYFVSPLVVFIVTPTVKFGVVHVVGGAAKTLVAANSAEMTSTPSDNITFLFFTIYLLVFMFSRYFLSLSQKL
jgi:hypothetical protein